MTQIELFADTDLRPPELIPDLPWYDLILISISGGKDSQTALRKTVAHCDAAGVPRTRLVCVFADLGPESEWPGTSELAAEHAAHYGLRFITTYRETAVGDTRRQQGLLEHIWNRGWWPDGFNRFCTSDLKRGPIKRVVTMLVRELRDTGVTGRRVRVLSVMGMRAQESPTRRLLPAFTTDTDLSNKTVREVHEWLPIHTWTVEQVWADIRESGVRFHYAYDLGLPRVSCMGCVLASKSALILSAQINPEVFERLVLVEADFVRRRAVITFAITAQWAGLQGPCRGERLWLMAGLKYIRRSGPWFKQNLSAGQILREARALPVPPPAEDWAA
jgi:3'-phosphoadenosine 5'-phosphosulfate sulfotransferase (PAPS reductase)/FAD synthetase